MKDTTDYPDNKRGYLKGDFELFHIKDSKNLKFEFHYHDFNKIIIFLSGNVTYLIEGRSYRLKPWDILIVNSSEIHKAIIDPSKMYERIIIWINQTFIEKHNSSDCNLLSCFDTALNIKNNLLRLNSEWLNEIKHILYRLEASCIDDKFGSHILKNSLILQFLVHLNRLFMGSNRDIDDNELNIDSGIRNVLTFINENLNGDLSIASLSDKFYISKYYLMHKFKEQTGYTIHNYITQKRLILARMLIKKGVSASEASMECGFGDYSSFIRAFKKMFKLSPKKYYKSIIDDEKMCILNNHYHN